MGVYHFPRRRRRSRPPGESSRQDPSRARLRRQLAGLTPLEQVSHHEHLIDCYEALRQGGGRAAGVDRVGFEQLGNRDVAELMRELSGRLRDDRYRPAPRRRKAIPKADGVGRRTLSIPTVTDRVVAKAIERVLGPLFEPTFRPGSYGFRPGRDQLLLLADLGRAIDRTGRHVVVQDDVRSAFDRIRIADLMEALRERVQEERLLDLVEIVVRGGGADRDRPLGLPQGDPFSPLALNVVLNRVHDEPLDRQEGPPPWFRYADNLVYLARDVCEGHQILAQTCQRLSKIGLELKGQDGPPADLRTSSTKLLGYLIAWRDGRLVLRVDETAWRALRRELERTHDEPDPGEAARQLALGWASSFGPALAEHRWASNRDRLLRHLAETGHREVAIDAVEQAAHEAYDRWVRLSCPLGRDSVRNGGEVERDGASGCRQFGD
jgi:group II intron reverse transcriptase/maturase